MFASAMMRENTADASKALNMLDRYQHSFAVRNVLAAAYYARINRIERARAFWDQAKREQPMLMVSPDVFFSRLPMSPKVCDKLREWLKPVL
jgi:hypothetical protein